MTDTIELWDEMYHKNEDVSKLGSFYLSGLIAVSEADVEGNLVVTTASIRNIAPVSYKPVLSHLIELEYIEKITRGRVIKVGTQDDMLEPEYTFLDNIEESEEVGTNYTEAISDMMEKYFEEYKDYCRASRKIAFFDRIYREYRSVMLSLNKGEMPPKKFLIFTRIISSVYNQVLAIDLNNGTAKDFTQVKYLTGSGDTDIVLAAFVYFQLNAKKFKTNDVNLYTFRHHFIKAQSELNKSLKGKTHGRSTSF